MHVSFQIRVFLFSRYMPRSGISESYDNSIFSFLRNLWQEPTICGLQETHFNASIWQTWSSYCLLRFTLQMEEKHSRAFCLSDCGSPDWMGEHRGKKKERPILGQRMFVPSRCSCIQLCVTLWTAACQASLSVGFSRHEYWGGMPYPPPGELPRPEIKPASLMSPILAGWFLPLAPYT